MKYMGKSRLDGDSTSIVRKSFSGSRRRTTISESTLEFEVRVVVCCGGGKMNGVDKEGRDFKALQRRIWANRKVQSMEELTVLSSVKLEWCEMPILGVVESLVPYLEMKVKCGLS